MGLVVLDHIEKTKAADSFACWPAIADIAQREGGDLMVARRAVVGIALLEVVGFFSRQGVGVDIVLQEVIDLFAAQQVDVGTDRLVAIDWCESLELR